jgi:hypothetical protein
MRVLKFNTGLILILVFLFYGAARAAVATSNWVGGAAGNWNGAANWLNSDASVRFPTNGADQFNVFITPAGGANVAVNGLTADHVCACH